MSSLAIVALALSVALLEDVSPPAPLPPTPSKRHLAWHELDYYAFVHFNMNTFTGREWGEGDEDEALFSPTALDCRQWARVVKDAGMEAIILTAKHHDGFCLWQTRLTDHSVKKSPWKDGKGDVLKELSDACREYGLRFGVYLSPWDRNQPCYGDSPRYNDYFVAQLEEVLTGYGEIFEVWFDGACGEGPNGKKQEYDWPRYIATVRKHQPNAVIFSDAGPDIRWVGNEKGFAGETNWSMLRRDEFYPGTPNYAQLTEGHENGDYWVAAECDVSIRPGWYYHEDQDDAVKSVEHLMSIWYGSVGRNASLLLNLPVDRRGLVHENDVARLMEFKAERQRTFAVDFARSAKATSAHTRGGVGRFAPGNAFDDDPGTYFATDDGVNAATIDVELSSDETIDHVELGEHLALGQRVRAFHVEALVDGAFVKVTQGTTIGKRRIVRLDEPVRVRTLRIVIDDSRASPTLARIGLFGPAD